MGSSTDTDDSRSKPFHGPIRGILKRRTLNESLSSLHIHPCSNNKNKVDFDLVKTYVHPIIRGDYEGVKGGGPSLTIGWDAQSEEVCTVGEADVRRDLQGRTKNVKVFSKQERCLLLIASGYTIIELLKQEEEHREKGQEQETKLFEWLKIAATKLMFRNADSPPTGTRVGNTAA